MVAQNNKNQARFLEKKRIYQVAQLMSGWSRCFRRVSGVRPLWAVRRLAITDKNRDQSDSYFV